MVPWNQVCNLIYNYRVEILLMVFYVFLGISAYYRQEYAKIGYWLSAIAITISVMFMKG